MTRRIGQFSGQTFEWNAPLNVVHPPDNVIKGTQYHPILRDNLGQYTEEQLIDLEQQIRELEAILKVDRSYTSWRN